MTTALADTPLNHTEEGDKVTTNVALGGLAPAELEAMERAAQAAWSIVSERYESGDSAEHLFHALVLVATQIALPQENWADHLHALQSELEDVMCESDYVLRTKARVPNAVPRAHDDSAGSQSSPAEEALARKSVWRVYAAA